MWISFSLIKTDYNGQICSFWSCFWRIKNNGTQFWIYFNIHLVLIMELFFTSIFIQFIILEMLAVFHLVGESYSKNLCQYLICIHINNKTGLQSILRPVEQVPLLGGWGAKSLWLTDRQAFIYTSVKWSCTTCQK